MDPSINNATTVSTIGALSTTTASGTNPSVTAAPSTTTIDYQNKMTWPMNTTCAAGDLCQIIPPGSNDVSKSSHRCGNCAYLIHCVLYCGKKLGELDFNLVDSMLTPYGQKAIHAASNRSNLVICFKCIDTLKSACAQEGSASALTIPPSVSADDDESPTGVTDGNSTNDAVVTVQTPSDYWKSKAYSIGYLDIAVSASECNPVKKAKEPPMTKLRGINAGEVLIPTASIILDDLRKMGSKAGISGSRGKAKKAMCDALVAFRVSREQQQANGTLDETDTNSKPIRFVALRYFNVLFGEKMKPLLAQRGRTLSKAELQEKLSTDQKLFEAFIDEYNDDTNTAYSTHAHGSVERFQDASKFQIIPRTMWAKAGSRFKDFTGEYEHHYNASKASGSHGGFQTSNQTMMYMHECLEQSPELLDTCMSFLPDGVFCESSSGAPPASHKTGGTKRKGGRGGGGKGKRGSNGSSSSEADQTLQSIRAKNDVHTRKATNELQSHLEDQLDKTKEKRTAKLVKLKDDFGSRGAVKAQLEKLKKGSNSTAGDDDLSLSDDEEITESQQERLEDYDEVEERIKRINAQLKANQATLEEYLPKPKKK